MCPLAKRATGVPYFEHRGREAPHSPARPVRLMDFTYRGVWVSDNAETVTFFGPGQPRDRYYAEIDSEGHWSVTQEEMRDWIRERLG